MTNKNRNFNDINSIDQILDLFFGDKFFQPASDIFKSNYPPVNQYLIENDDKTKTMVIEIALAGKDKESISLSLSENNKYINVEVAKDEVEDDAENRKHYIYRNIANRSIKQKIPIYFLTTKELVTSEFKNGLLTIQIKERKAENTTIDIL